MQRGRRQVRCEQSRKDVIVGVEGALQPRRVGGEGAFALTPTLCAACGTHFEPQHAAHSAATVSAAAAAGGGCGVGGAILCCE